MNQFKPTFLYIKQHKITGLLYFGKTTKNPEKYHGSGVYWKRHLKKHGHQIETLWYCLFNDQNLCTEFAVSFSEQEDIVHSKLWANAIIENGLDGAQVGHPSFITNPEEVARKISETHLELWQDPEHRQKMIEAQKSSWTEERKQKNSETMKQLWTPERKARQSCALRGRKGTRKLKGVPKTAEHNRKNSEALKGRSFSEEHKKAISEAKKLQKVCRLFDKRVMSIGHFTRWVNSLSNTATDSTPP